MEAVIFIGIQGAGKSSFYKERFFQTHVRINLDMLRTRRRERVLLRACIEAQQPFVVDNTNATVAARAPYITAAKPAGFRLVAYYFPANIADALRRNSRRSGRERVPDKGVWGTFKRLAPPRRAEGFDALYSAHMNEAGLFVVEEWSDEVLQAGQEDRQR